MKYSRLSTSFINYSELTDINWKEQGKTVTEMKLKDCAEQDIKIPASTVLSSVHLVQLYNQLAWSGKGSAVSMIPNLGQRGDGSDSRWVLQTVVPSGKRRASVEKAWPLGTSQPTTY